MNKFAIEFFKLYDRKIASGEIRFSELGISKDDFTRLCTDSEFTVSKEKAIDLCNKMKLTKEEGERLLSSYK